MKIYVNYNFCGYRWFTINDIFHPTNSRNITLNEWDGENTSVLLSKLMLYDVYDVFFLHENNKYILALRHLQEQNHKDPDGRKLAMSYVFVGNLTDRDLMEKLMYVYINHKAWLENALSELISSSVDHVEYNNRSLLELLTAIKEKEILNYLHLGKGKVIAIFSKWRNDTISSNLGLKLEEFIKVKFSLDEYFDLKLIDQPIIITEMKQLSSEDLVQKITSSPSSFPPEKFTFKQFFTDLKSLLKRQIAWKDFCKKYCSQLCFMCTGLIVGVLIGLCF